MSDANPARSDTAEKPRYHHGDLRAALLRAAEDELAEKGIESFSLRSVAKRAGVSHAAPAHHFGDVTGLLSALAAEGFRQFLQAQHAREARAGDAADAKLVAAGLGYIDFATARPALFRLIFSSQRTDFEAEDLKAESFAAFAHLVDQVRALGGPDPWTDEAAMRDVAAMWAIVHGLADLIVAGRIRSISTLAPDARDTAVEAIIRRMLPGRPPAR